MSLDTLPQRDAAALAAALRPHCARLFAPDLAGIYHYVDLLCLHLCFRAAHECGLLPARPEPLAAIAARRGVAAEATYLLEAILALLAEEGYAVRTEEGWAARRPCPPDGSVALQRQARAAYPQALATFDLIERCHEAAPAVLAGALPGLAAIFPRGDLSLWERVYDADRVMSLYADLIPPALDAVLPPRARVLEVGAGVGAVARRCLPLLRERDTEEYWFTDIGKVFVQRARSRYGHEPCLRFAPLDLDRPLAQQGVVTESFDVVTAVNVLHVARDLPFTLRELLAALKAPGWLVLAEGSPPDRSHRWWLDLVFAFLRGWWDVSLDACLRPRAGFLLPAEWERALLACGYARVHLLPGEDWFTGPCRGGLVIAEKGAGRDA